MRRSRWLLIVLIVGLSVGADQRAGLALAQGAMPEGIVFRDDPNPATTDPATAVVGQGVPIEPANHVPQDASLAYNTRPPTSGMHYPTWVQTYGVLDPPPPTGNWVHNLEHGAVVILYNCPDDCPEVVQQLEDLYPTLPKGRNSRGGQPRVLILPYPDMDTTIAAVSWGWLLQQDQLNTDELTDFVEQHIDRGPECVDQACP
jgi:hypothetical protein